MSKEMLELADRIERRLAVNGCYITEPVAWTNQAQLGFLKDRAYSEVPMAMWSKRKEGVVDVPLYTHPAPAAPVPASVREAAQNLIKVWHDAPADVSFGMFMERALIKLEAAIASLPAPEAAPTREEIAIHDPNWEAQTGLPPTSQVEDEMPFRSGHPMINAVKDVAERHVAALASTEAELDKATDALNDCLGCVTAAEAEGLHEVIAELRGTNDLADRLIDLVERRLLFVRGYVEDALSDDTPQERIAPPPLSDAARQGRLLTRAEFDRISIKVAE